jgi:peptidyl-prolyl cis-trans isomerase SurA
MLMRRILSCTVAVLLGMPLLAQVDPVVMTVNGYDVTQSEFEYFFEKNNIETKVTKKTVRQYADLYLNFKLKVQAALDEGLDKSESFLSEYKMCRDMQAEDYVIDYDFLEEVARNSYEQSLIEIGEPGLMHVFVMSATPDANVGRTLDDCFEQMKSVYEKLQAGGSFQDLAKEYSTDNLAASGGEAGWLAANQMPDDIADIILSLEPGQYSEPFVSNRTAFIVMLDARRDLGTYEDNRDDIYDWMRDNGTFDKAKQRRANEYAARLGWTERDDAAVARLDSTLEEVEPDFGNISREYHDGLLVFDISNREIWERVSNHPEELNTYFEAHRKQFNFDKPCFKGMVLFCQKEEDFNELKAILEKQDMSEWVNSILAFNSNGIKVRVLRSSSETDLFRQGQNEYVDKVVFGQGEYKPMNGFPYVNVVGRVLKQPDSISDVAAEVSEEYQKYLENEWIKRLKSKYKYKINKKALKKVK